jgi:ABC-type sugar transport system ATPase subunit
LLRLISGLERPYRIGALRLNGVDVSEVPAFSRNCTTVFQNYALFPHMTVGANVEYGLKVRGVAKQEREERSREALALVRLADKYDRKIHQLSGGERQRVALARALVREPDLFLLDEPLSNLDAQLRVDMRTELRRLQRELGTTMVYVTHDQVEALTLGDRVAVLREGALEQVGEPDELYQRPATRFVATFVGSPSMNLLPATVADGSLRAGPFVLPRPPRLDDSGLGGQLEVGLRPEHLQLAGEHRLAGGAALVEAPGEVLAVEPAGNETYVHVRCGGFRLVLRSSPGVGARVGDGAVVQADAAAVHVFDSASGQAL